MKVSEWKLENSIEIGDENFEMLSEIETFSKAELVKGAKFMDALLDDNGGVFDGTTIYFMDSELGLFDIVDDPEWDDEIEVSLQKFKVKPKA